MLKKNIALLLFTVALLSACDMPDPGMEKGSAAGQEGLLIADTARASGDLDTAIRLYTQAAMQSKQDVTAHLALASIYRQQKKPDQAAEVLRHAQTLQPHNTQVLAALGSALLASGNAEAALPVFDQALAQDEGQVAVLNGKGVALDTIGDHVQAQAVYQQALTLDPLNASIKNNLALSLILGGKPKEAIPMLEALTAGADSNSTIRQNLALAYGLAGNRSQALKMGLKDLQLKDAQENLRFYEYYQQNSPKGEPPVNSVSPIRIYPSAAPVVTPSAKITAPDAGTATPLMDAPVADAPAVERAAPPLSAPDEEYDPYPLPSGPLGDSPDMDSDPSL